MTSTSLPLHAALVPLHRCGAALYGPIVAARGVGRLEFGLLYGEYR